MLPLLFLSISVPSSLHVKVLLGVHKFVLIMALLYQRNLARSWAELTAADADVADYWLRVYTGDRCIFDAFEER